MLGCKGITHSDYDASIAFKWIPSVRCQYVIYEEKVAGLPFEPDRRLFIYLPQLRYRLWIDRFAGPVSGIGGNQLRRKRHQRIADGLRLDTGDIQVNDRVEPCSLAGDIVHDYSWGRLAGAEILPRPRIADPVCRAVVRDLGFVTRTEGIFPRDTKVTEVTYVRDAALLKPLDEASRN